MAKREKNENAPSNATEVKPSELVAENIPPAKASEITPVDAGGNSDGIKLAEGSEKPEGENAPPINPPENPQPVASAPAPSAPDLPPVATVTASQLVSEQLPTAGPTLPPVPGQTGPKRGRGRPSIPHPECKKCGRKHKPGSCVVENGESRIVIPGDSQNSPGEEIHDNPIEETPGVNYRQMAEVMFDLTTNTAAAFIGPEWRADGDIERNGVVIPLEAYFRSQEMKDIPPGAVLCFACAGYAAARLRHQNTRSKFQLAWLWIKSKIPGKRKQFTPKVVNNGENPFSEKN